MRGKRNGRRRAPPLKNIPRPAGFELEESRQLCKNNHLFHVRQPNELPTETRPIMNLIKTIFGTKNDRDLKRLQP